MIVIYKITSPTGKIYIGQTCNFAQRMRAYSKMNKKSSQAKIRNSILKYGWLSHVSEIIDQTEDDIIANLLETKYIKHFDSFRNGLNCTETGTNTAVRGRNVTEECKKKISIRIKELYKDPTYKPVRYRPHTEQAKKKMKMSRSLQGPCSEETKQKMRQARLGKPLSSETKDKLSKIRKGRINPTRGLSDDKVMEIRKLLSVGLKCSRIEKVTGVKQRTVLRIKHNQIYQNIL